MATLIGSSGRALVIAAAVGATILSGLALPGTAQAATSVTSPVSIVTTTLATHDSNDSGRAVDQARKRVAKADAAQKDAAKAAETAAAALAAADTAQRRAQQAVDQWTNAWKSADNGNAAAIKLFVQLQNEYYDDPTPARKAAWDQQGARMREAMKAAGGVKSSLDAANRENFTAIQDYEAKYDANKAAVEAKTAADKEKADADAALKAAESAHKNKNGRR